MFLVALYLQTLLWSLWWIKQEQEPYFLHLPFHEPGESLILTLLRRGERKADFSEGAEQLFSFSGANALGWFCYIFYRWWFVMIYTHLSRTCNKTEANVRINWCIPIGEHTRVPNKNKAELMKIMVRKAGFFCEDPCSRFISLVQASHSGCSSRCRYW